MGMFEKLFPKITKGVDANKYFLTLNGYTPVFRSWDGKLYESDLVRASIDARSRHVSKLGVLITGSAQPKLQTRLKRAPNSWQTWSQFIYRLNTILDNRNTAFIVPVYDKWMEWTGIASVVPEKYELVDVSGVPWIRFTFNGGNTAAEELSNVGIMTKFQYESDFFGSDNEAMNETMELINMQNQGITEGVKQASSYQFYAQVSNFTKPEDLKKERKRFNEENLKSGEGGLLLFPNTYSNINQVATKPYTINPEERKIIQQNVFNYFGVNEKILQNSALGNDLDAFFNGMIEPFAIQFSEVMTKMLFTETEQAHGASFIASANRLQYMTVAEKTSMAQQLGDRGAILIDEIRALFNYPPLPDGAGQNAPIRGEYYMVNDDKESEVEEDETE